MNLNVLIYWSVFVNYLHVAGVHATCLLAVVLFCPMTVLLIKRAGCWKCICFKCSATHLLHMCAPGLSKWVLKTEVFRFFLNLKISKNPNFRFFKTYKPQVTSPNFSFFTRVTNLIQMVFKYELRFVAFTWPNLCSWVVIL